MYINSQMSIQEFVTDTNIKLPRFQRKKVWSNSQNFLLAVSIFKNYPMGVIIFNESNDDSTKVRYLLDGRQRMNALTEMYSNPEQIYFWAKEHIGFKNTNSTDNVISNVIDKIKEYIAHSSSEDSEVDGSKDSEEQDEVIEFNNYNNTINDVDMQGLDINCKLKYLISLIKLAHEGSDKNTTGLTNKFNFSSYFRKTTYIENNKVNAKQLRSFLEEYKKWCYDNKIDFKESTNFINFYKWKFEFKNPDSESKFNLYLSINWNELLDRIKLFDELNTLFKDYKIATITLSDILYSDAQKIFDVINTKGTLLTPAQVLSAKLKWNEQVDYPCANLVDITRSLYKKWDIDFDEKIYKWDVAATFVKRIENRNIFLNDTDTTAEKNVGYGFNILSGLFQDGVRQTDIENLSKNTEIVWDSGIDELVNNINNMLNVVLDFSYFKFLRSWNKPMMKILTDYSSIDFILLLYKRWIQLGNPIGSSTIAKKFKKDAFILFDRLVYENLCGQWSGSADKKIGDNLKNIDKSFEPITEESWKNLINNICDKGTINDVEIKNHKKLQPMLYHYYCMKGIQGPGEYKIDIDHIMPKSAIEASQLNDKDICKNNIYNLALLPKGDNCSKNDKYLNQINDIWLISQIEKYEEIPQSEFDKFSDLNNIYELKTLRKPLFIEAFTQKRNQIINN